MKTRRMNITHQIQPSLNQLYLTQLSCLADWQIFWPQLAKLLSKDSELAALTFQHLTPDSRLVEQGSVFFALEGAIGKGKDFLPQAKAKGASLLVLEGEEVSLEVIAKNCWQLSLPQLSSKLGELLAHLAQLNLESLNCIAVTGTNGKSSVAHYLCQMLEASQQPAVLIGTLGMGRLANLQPNPLTTPGLFSLYQLVSYWQQQGINRFVLEASSHALEQARLAGLPITSGIFTNLSHDHLDYHHTLEKYAAAKFKLFQRPELQQASFNLQEANSLAWLEKLANQATRPQLFAFSLGQLKPETLELITCLNKAERIKVQLLEATDLTASPQGQTAKLLWQGKTYQLKTRLVGAFNVENILAAFTALLAQGWQLAELLPLAEQLESPAGRMQQLAKQAHQPQVLVDFAHTPAALENLLLTLQQTCVGKLICVLGCGGNRDASKRPLMGEIAAKLSQRVVITDDNPRYEDAAAIRQEVLAGAEAAKSLNPSLEIYNLADRKQAIEQAIHLAQPDDWVVLVGKGHETYQEIAGHKYEFCDVSVAQQALATYKAHHQ